MSDTVQLTDQYLLSSTLKSEPHVHVAREKTIATCNDKQSGAYNGLIEIDAKDQLTGAKGFGSLKEAYLNFSYVVTAKNTGNGDLAAVLSRFACTLKTGVWNLISDLEVQLGGKTIITSNEYRSFWNNLRAQTEFSTADVYKHGSEMFLQPDDWYSINFANDSHVSGDGYSNNLMDVDAGFDPTLGQAREAFPLNSGFVERLKTATPVVADETTNNGFGWASLGKKATVQIAQQHGRSVFIESTTAAQGAIAGTWIFNVKIRLVDLHPVFKELDLIANPQLYIRYRVNTGKVEIGGNSNTLHLESSTITSGNTCPIMVASASSKYDAVTETANGIKRAGAMYGVLDASETDKITFAFGAMENEFSSRASISKYLPYQSTRITVPFYDLVDARQIVSKPIKKVKYLDCYAQYFTGYCGKGTQDNQFNAPFDFQISGNKSNVKYVAVMPFAETSSGHWKKAHGTQQFASPFDSAPWTLMPGGSIRNFQVQVGNKNAFAKSHEYDYETFLDEFSKLGAINGDMTREMNNGLINFDKWQWAHRVMVADVSRFTEKDVPSAIKVSGTNTCSQGMNLLVLVVYEREMEIDLLTGEVLKNDL